MNLTHQQTQAIVRHRLKNPGKRININQKIMIRDWQMIANQFTKAEVTAQPRAMKLIFFYAFSFSSFQVSERIRHQISVFFTPQTDFRSSFVFFSVMFFSSFAASSSPTLQPQERPQPKFKIKKSRSMTDAIQMGGTEPPASADPNRQARIGKKIQTPNTLAVKALVARLAQKCFCKNDVA